MGIKRVGAARPKKRHKVYRDCTSCGEEMVGIMLISNPAPRYRCTDCGGDSRYERKKLCDA